MSTQDTIEIHSCSPFCERPMCLKQRIAALEAQVKELKSDAIIAPAWVACESRGPWARNSLKHAAADLRERANKARKAFNKDYMGEPCRFIADAYDKAADAIQLYLEAMQHAQQGEK